MNDLLSNCKQSITSLSHLVGTAVVESFFKIPKLHQKTLFRITCADPERGGGLGVRTQPLDNHRAIGYLSNAKVRIHWKITQLPSKNICWAIIAR